MLLPLGGNRRKDRERDLSAVWHAVTPCPSLCTYRAVQLRLLLGIKLCFLKEVHIHPLRNTTYILLLMIHLGIHKTALGKAVLNTCSAVDFTGEKRGKDHQKLIWLSGNCLGHLYQTYRGSQPILLMTVTSYCYWSRLLNMKITNSLLLLSFPNSIYFWILIFYISQSFVKKKKHNFRSASIYFIFVHFSHLIDIR